MFSRNNEDRLGTSKGSDGSVEVQSIGKQEGLSLDFVVPTEFVELPSGGKFYPKGHPLNGVDSIEIRFMTTKDEDILTSKSLLKKGVAIDRLLQNLLVDRSIDIKTLTIGDKNAILVAARISAYGSRYVTNVTCPVCSSTTKWGFDLSKVVEEHGDFREEDDKRIELSESATFIIRLPMMGVDVECRVLSGEDESRMIKKEQDRKKRKMLESTTTDFLSMIIVSVNGVKDRTEVDKLVSNMPTSDSMVLREKYSEIIPKVELERDFSCSECGVEQIVEVPFTTDFFWPQR